MLLLLSIALQLGARGGNESTPPAGDSAGYWQQRASYTIVAALDEAKERVSGVGDLRYVNYSPDTLREMYVHQYLNAFRPGSKWSAIDEREGRDRFQRLRDPDNGYERFTAPVTVNGVAVRVEYPGAPDSTVVRFALPLPLGPGDSVTVHFEWEARPSTLPRRQGRRGRHWDLAQWYPKVAVYDRHGWQPNALTPAGELYGEFGTFDVTLVVASDQVLGATGVVVAGDPGWARVKQWGEIRDERDTYPEMAGAGVPAAPPGFKAVRFYARDIHEFAWTASPEYRYEGGSYADRIAIHVLYRPGDEKEWGGGQAVQRTARALSWLESIYGAYAYPQETNVHRLDGGGTEFPMMIMDGSASPGLILHESGHIYSFGILANNEWRSGWMDEGLTSFQTSWALRLSPIDRAHGESPPGPPPAGGYRALAVAPKPWDAAQIGMQRLVLSGIAQPIGFSANDFSDFGVYNTMIYSRAENMYTALRDMLGDTGTVAWLHRYYADWKLKHVDEAAMRGAVERSSGKKWDWFFDQWVHRVGVIDYSLDDATTERAAGGFVTHARIARRSGYRHTMPVGVRTASGWTIQRGDAANDEETLVFRTTDAPLEVRLDPRHTTEDWDRRNDVAHPRWLPRIFDPRTKRLVLEWPFLDQSDRDRTVIALAPLVWYSSTGGVNIAARARTNYEGMVDRAELGLGLASRRPRYTSSLSGAGTYADDLAAPLSRIQAWATVENPRLPGAAQPVMGLATGVWMLDGVIKGELRRAWDDSPHPLSRTSRIAHSLALTATFPYESKWLDFARFTDVTTVDARATFSRSGADATGVSARATAMGGWVSGQHIDQVGGHFLRRAELELKKVTALTDDGMTVAFARLFGAGGWNTPLQRSVGIASLDFTDTFSNHLLRPTGSVFSPRNADDIHYTSLGGFALRGYSPLLVLRDYAGASANAELARSLVTFGPRASRSLALWAHAFGDIGSPIVRGYAATREWPADAGVGLAVRGQLFDRDIHVRAELPLWARQPALAIGSDRNQLDRVRFRWTFSLQDLW
ncbi:MAG: M1 family metallopeptidase [Gemmatimonadaceae bacterium]